MMGDSLPREQLWIPLYFVLYSYSETRGSITIIKKVNLEMIVVDRDSGSHSTCK